MLKIVRSTTVALSLLAGSLAWAADTQPPQISFSSPSPSAILSAGQSVNISANVTDNVAVATAAIYVGGQQICIKTAPPFSCSWVVPSNPASRYFIEVRALDSSHNNSESGFYVAASGSSSSPSPTPAPTAVATPPPGVVDTQDPQILITAPSQSAVVSAGQNVTISANVTDNVAVASAAIFVGGQQLGNRHH